MNPVNPMLPEALTARFLRSIRKQFYPGAEKHFFQELNLLKQAIAYPANWLDMRGVRLNAERYQAILTTVIRTVNQNGNLAAVRSPGRYLLHAVQEHMKHQGETYYNQAKSTRNAIDAVMAGLRPAPGATTADDQTVPVLAQAYRVLAVAKPAGGRKKAAPKPAPPAHKAAPDLFGQNPLLILIAAGMILLMSGAITSDAHLSALPPSSRA